MQVISVRSSKKTELIDITDQVQSLVKDIKSGICFLYVPHTTGGIVINEGADPAVARDILAVLNEVIPWDFNYHHLEGNSPAHVKSSLTGPGVFVFIEEGRLLLGTWQRIFFAEYDGPRTRKVWIKILQG